MGRVNENWGASTYELEDGQKPVKIPYWFTAQDVLARWSARDRQAIEPIAKPQAEPRPQAQAQPAQEPARAAAEQSKHDPRRDRPLRRHQRRRSRWPRMRMHRRRSRGPNRQRRKCGGSYVLAVVEDRCEFMDGPPLSIGRRLRPEAEERMDGQNADCRAWDRPGKNSCSVAGLDANGAVVLRRRMGRDGLPTFASKLPACIVAMEACCGAHFLGRTFASQGHTVRLMPPEYVQPYVKSQKTDDRDAEAIAEAATRPTMRLVTLKSEAQLDLQVLHRARERLVTARTRLTNQLRAVLLERGVILPKRRAPLRHRLHELMAGELPISHRVIRLLQELRAEWASLDERIRGYDDELAALTRENQQARQLATIPGIGVINATALLAAVGDGSAFAKGRDRAAWLGLTPRVIGPAILPESGL